MSARCSVTSPVYPVDHVYVAETARRVMITVWVRDTSGGRICAGGGDTVTRLVRLAHPLGGRELIDGSLTPPAIRLSAAPGSPATTRPTAMAACDRALNGAASATWTTVAEIRSLRIGPGVRPAPNAFPRARPTDVAAWCWRLEPASPGGPSPGPSTLWQAYGVHDEQAVKVGAYGFNGSPPPAPSGPPVIP